MTKNELHFLLFYDGIHYTPGNSNNKQTAEQESESARREIGEFIANQQVTFMDWPLEYKPQDIHQALEKDESMSPKLREGFQFTLDSISSKVHSHYRDANGQIGMLQHVKIKNAKKWFAKANEMINVLMIEHADKGDWTEFKATWPHTAALLEKSARNDHRWVRIVGHSIVVEFPVHRGEWTAIKSAGVREFLKSIQELPKAYRETGKNKKVQVLSTPLKSIVQILAGAPLSYSENNGRVRIRWSDSKSASTFRQSHIADNVYKSNLESHLVNIIPHELHLNLAKQLVRGEREQMREVDAMILKWGPRETEPFALWKYANTLNGNQQINAVKHLQAWAVAWNKDQTYPQAPVNARTASEKQASVKSKKAKGKSAPNSPTEYFRPKELNPAPKPIESQADVEDYLSLWRGWFKVMREYPAGLVPFLQ